MNPQQPIIQVKEVKRFFRSVKKEEGTKGSLNLLVRPKYEQHQALKGVSFSIEPGSFVGLIGANGAGKTTLLKILSGLIPPSTGEARVLGYEPFRRAIKFRQSISLVMGQKAQLWWDLPASDAFDLIRAIYEIPLPIYRERLHALAELLDVQRHLHTQIRRLSLGERMKMELIGAILHWPKVIFLDEPTIGLDVLAAHKLREFLKVFNQKEKATLILTSHNMDDIERLCSRVLILRSGEIIYDGKPTGLTREGERRLRLRLLQNPTAAELAEKVGIPLSSVDIEGNEEAGSTETAPEGAHENKDEARTFHVHLRTEQIVPVLQAVMKTYTISDMGVEEQSLEKVIQRIYSTPRTGESV